MRRFVSFDCAGARLMGTLDKGDGPYGLLIVSGGNEPRAGARQSMARLSADLARHGISCFRFDRRGIGDSEGPNLGFAQAQHDISAALAAFRKACPAVQHIVAYGNCDAAAALLLHPTPEVTQLILSNIWLGDAADGLPPAKAIRRDMGRKIFSYAAWARLLRGRFDGRKLLREMVRLARRPKALPLAGPIAQALSTAERPTRILLSSQDATAMRFSEAWSTAAFKAARKNPHVQLRPLNTASHAFAQQGAYDLLYNAVRDALGR